MKTKNKKLFITAFILALFAGIFTSCYTPNPLYGTWGDNLGNSIQFRADNTFAAKVTNSMGNVEQVEGTWACIENALILKKDSGTSFNTEWDIRGSMLYLEWVDNLREVQYMTLYHISK
ncbi:MAG: hypothetical protein MJ181_10340 [Treponema sp.]|nr:hypothetical protein [Treponema sp.]